LFGGISNEDGRGDDVTGTIVCVFIPGKGEEKRGELN